MLDIDDCEFSAVLRSFECGDYCSATSLSWSCVTRTLGTARNRYLTNEDLNGIGITHDPSQSKVFKLLTEKLFIDDSETPVEIDRLLQQQIKADFSLEETTAEEAQEAMDRAISIISAIQRIIETV